jgi:integrase
MSPPRKRARLWLRPARRSKAGKVTRRAVWIILDSGRHIATGCSQAEIGRAEQVLAEYITRKYQPERLERELSDIDMSDVLSIYLDDCANRHANQKRFRGRISRLNDFWGGRNLADVTGASCREYVKHRGSSGGARRDLEDLRAAINHHAKEGFHRGLVRVVLPAKGPARDQWLSRQQTARLLWACWRTREVQTTSRGPDKGHKVNTDRYPLRHISRFILIALYTGTRPGAVLTSSPVRGEGRSFADLEQGILFRLAKGKRATNKRQPPVPLPGRLLAHMRRWVRQGLVKNYFVEWNGKPVQSIKVGFKRALVLSGIKGKVTPHTLRHTAATWRMQAGVPIWETAGFLGMSPDMVEHIYGHHHPDHMRGAAEAIGRHGRTNHSLVVPLAQDQSAKRKAHKD